MLKSVEELELFIQSLKKGQELVPIMSQILRELRFLRMELDKHFQDEFKAVAKARAIDAGNN